jgi:exopolysaccharide biosynthesis polyprenyl glycosylphosphotransferase
MLKEQSRLLATATFVVDLALVGIAFMLAHSCRATVLPFLFPDSFPQPFYALGDYLPLLPWVLVIWGLLLLSSDSYRSHRTVPLIDEAREIARVCAVGLVVLALSIYALRLDSWLLGQDEISRPWIVLLALFAGLLLLTEKLALRTLSRYVRASGFNYRTVLIVGTNPVAVELADSMVDHRYWGFRVLGFVSHPNSEEPLPAGRTLLGTVDDLMKIVESTVVDDILFCVGRRDLDRMEDVILALHEQGIRTRFALQLFPHARAKTQLEALDGIPILTFSTTPERFLPLIVKRALDIVLSVAMISLSLPVMLFIALLIKVTEGGQVVYRQTRCGLNGRRFTMYKFRTMVEDAEERQGDLMHLNEMDGPVFKLRRDPRVTWIGRFLRRFSLDELPQFLNVLRGDMSLVGPRPPIPAEVAKYQRWQRRRLSMKPGLTCLWQISGRNHLDFDRWMQLDLEYIDSWSPWLDLKILVKTVPAVLSGRGAS